MQLKEKVLKASGERNAVKLDHLRVAVCDDMRCLNGFREGRAPPHMVQKPSHSWQGGPALPLSIITCDYSTKY